MEILDAPSPGQLAIDSATHPIMVVMRPIADDPAPVAVPSPSHSLSLAMRRLSVMVNKVTKGVPRPFPPQVGDGNTICIMFKRLFPLVFLQ